MTRSCLGRLFSVASSFSSVFLQKILNRDAVLLDGLFDDESGIFFERVVFIVDCLKSRRFQHLHVTSATIKVPRADACQPRKPQVSAINDICCAVFCREKMPGVTRFFAHARQYRIQTCVPLREQRRELLHPILTSTCRRCTQR